MRLGVETFQKAGFSRRALVSLVLDALGSENHPKGGILVQNPAFAMASLVLFTFGTESHPEGGALVQNPAFSMVSIVLDAFESENHPKGAMPLQCFL